MSTQAPIAVKTGLTGRTVLLPGDDAALYEAQVARFVERFQAASHTAALKELQEERKRKTKARLDKAAREYVVAVEEERNDDWEPEQFEFEFSLEQIEVRAIELTPDLFDAWYTEHPEELVA